MTASRSLVVGGGEGSRSSTAFSNETQVGVAIDPTGVTTGSGAGIFWPVSIVVA